MVNNGVHMLYIQTYNDMHTYIYIYMAGGLEFGTFGYIWIFSHHFGNVIIPTDEVIFFRGVGIPPTRQGCANVGK